MEARIDGTDIMYSISSIDENNKVYKVIRNELVFNNCGELVHDKCVFDYNLHEGNLMDCMLFADNHYLESQNEMEI